MRFEPRISYSDQPLVKALLAAAGFVPRHKQDRLPRGIERESDPPDAAVRIETKLLHIGVLRSLQRIDARPAGAWAKRLDDLKLRKKFVLHRLRQRIELPLERVIE